MKQKIFFFTLMVLHICGTYAQSEKVYALPNLVGDNSIVRPWDNTKYLLYTEETNNNEKFILVDNTGQTVTAKEVTLKQWYKIKDFAIYNDSVFFIGVYKNSKGFWGYFDIQNVFYSGDTITYFLTNTFSTAFGTPYDDWGYSFVNFDELQILSLPGRTELLLTGSRLDETYVGGVLTHFSYTPCLFHVTPPYTNFSYAYNASISEKFDDIMRIGNYIVVVGRENYAASNSAKILFRIFNWSNFSFQTSLSNNLTRQDYNLSFSKVLTEPIGYVDNNVLATAHYGDLTPNRGLFAEYYSLQILNNIIGMNRNYYTFVGQSNPLASGCTIKKSAFNAMSSTLCVLQDMEAPLFNTITSAICKFDLANFPFVPCSTSYRTDNGIKINSITNSVYSNILFSGKRSSGTLLMRENVTSPANCILHEDMSATTDYAFLELSHTVTPLTSNYFSATRIPFYSSPTTNNCSVLCQ